MPLHGTVMSAAKKMKTGMRSMEIKKSDDGKGFIVEHNMHDHENPMNGTSAICTSHAALSKHIKEKMPLEEPEE